MFRKEAQKVSAQRLCQFVSQLKRGFPTKATHATHATNFRFFELTQRKEHNEMASLLDRPITATSDDDVCRWHATRRASYMMASPYCLATCIFLEEERRSGPLFWKNIYSVRRGSAMVLNRALVSSYYAVNSNHTAN